MRTVFVQFCSEASGVACSEASSSKRRRTADRVTVPKMPGVAASCGRLRIIAFDNFYFRLCPAVKCKNTPYAASAKTHKMLVIPATGHMLCCRGSNLQICNRLDHCERN